MTHPTPNDSNPPPESPGTAGDGNLSVPMKLRTFLEGVATIYDLPEERRRGPALPHPLKKVKPKGIPRARWNAILAAAAVISAIWAWDGIKNSPAEFGALPQVMNGGWRSNDPRYRNRSFWIKGDRIAFQTGSDSLEVTIHTITQVDQLLLPGDTLQFTVQYLVDGAPTTWAIQFVERPKPEIRFLNQRALVWRLAANSPWPTQ